MGHDQHFYLFNGTGEDRKYQEAVHAIKVNTISEKLLYQFDVFMCLLSCVIYFFSSFKV